MGLCDHLSPEVSYVEWMARRIVNIVATDDCPVQQCVAIVIKDLNGPLISLGPTSQPHYSCRITPGSLNNEWHPWVSPVVFAIEYVRDDSEDTFELASKRLANAFKETMMLFVPWYLDTRKSLKQLLPDWCVAYGVVCGLDKYTIR
ncbi:hypothetical protein SIIN_5423_T [Serendipita indica DSM 11827]|nr:hypothetical protein SIIN_5423_T [Serendipita indica DSM 11827]